MFTRLSQCKHFYVSLIPGLFLLLFLFLPITESLRDLYQSDLLPVCFLVLCLSVHTALSLFAQIWHGGAATPSHSPPLDENTVGKPELVVYSPLKKKNVWISDRSRPWLRFLCFFFVFFFILCSSRLHHFLRAVLVVQTFLTKSSQIFALPSSSSPPSVFHWYFVPFHVCSSFNCLHSSSLQNLVLCFSSVFFFCPIWLLWEISGFVFILQLLEPFFLFYFSPFSTFYPLFLSGDCF